MDKNDWAMLIMGIAFIVCYVSGLIIWFCVVAIVLYAWGYLTGRS